MSYFLQVEKSESKGPRKPSHKLFVGNLKEGTTSDELREIFEPHCKVKFNGPCDELLLLGLPNPR